MSANQAVHRMKPVSPNRGTTGTAQTSRHRRHCCAGERRGGQIAVEPFDIPTVGRSAVLMDPQVAMLSVLPPAAQQ
jgi:hypothetical protein